MTSWQHSNAILAREDKQAAARAIIVAGSPRQAELWRKRLAPSVDPSSQPSGRPLVVVERGRKGNLLGTLQAYKTVFLSSESKIDPVSLHQIVMLLGSGTRLSPFTQALGNIKAAFPLPDADAPPAGLTIGEAAIRSSSPWTAHLRAGGFDGVLMRWGDEVLVPGSSLTASPTRFADVDVVRLGWPTRPTSLLATQKEWLLVDEETGLVIRDIPRQSLDSLDARLHAVGNRVTKPYVNLGSFAASHRFLRVACKVFGSHIDDERTAVNWDPYFWIALQCPDSDAWRAMKHQEAKVGMAGARDLEKSFPEFFGTVQTFKRILKQDLGREIRVSVLDFGEPYWIDAGNHVALRATFADIFERNDQGRTARAFLGLPDSIAEGGSFVQNSRIVPGVGIRNSVVIGSQISHSDSDLERAIVIGSRVGFLTMTKGGVAISCFGDELRVDGPNGVAFRFDGNGKVRGQESVTTLRVGERSVIMRYDASLGTIDDDTFSEAVLGNPMSYRAAAELMNTIDTTSLDRFWDGRRAEIGVPGG